MPRDPLRILIVDASPLRRAWLRRALAPSAWAIEETGEVEAAAARPDVDVILAWEEPHAPRVRGIHGARPATPLVAIVPRIEDAPATFEAGAVACVWRDAVTPNRLAMATRTAAWVGALEARLDVAARQEVRAWTQRPLRVLAVDDSASARAYVRFSLDRTRIQLTSAETGSEALAAARAAPFDAVLVDSILPDMEGPEVVRELQESAPAAAVVGLTSASEDEVERRFLDAGALAYLTKDSAMPLFLEPTVRTALRLARLSQAFRATPAGTAWKGRVHVGETPDLPA